MFDENSDAYNKIDYKTIEEGKWSKIELEFISPANFNAACAGFFLPKNAAGKIWWDNFSIEPVK